MRKRWQPPMLHDHNDHNHEHKATWLELFYDLIFVVIIGELTHLLAKDISLMGAAAFIFLFIPVWWTWISTTFYNNRFDSNDITQRLFTFTSILGIIAMTFFIHDGLAGSSIGFALSYLFVRALIVFMWARAGYYNKSVRTESGHYVLSFAISMTLWIISIFVDPPYRFWLWSAGLAIELVTPILSIKLNSSLRDFSFSSHIPERFGLFMIIVLGESILGIVLGLTETHHFTFNSILNSFLASILIFAIWSLYFDHINSRPIKQNIYNMASWTYTHLPLVTSISALSAAIIYLIVHNGDIVPINVVWLICGAMAIALTSIGLLELNLAKKEETPCKTKLGKIVRFGGATLCIVLALLPMPYQAWQLLGLLILVFAAQIIQGESCCVDHCNHDHAHIG